LGFAGDVAMSDLEFERELSPEQIREALSLLDSKAGAQNQNVRVEDLNPAEELHPKPEPSSTAIAQQDCAPAAEDSKRRKKHLNFAVAWYGVAIAVAGVLALLSWGERALAPPPLIARAQLPNRAAAAPANNASPALPVGNPLPDQSGSERQPSSPEVAGSSPIGYASRDDDQAAARDAANSENAVPSSAPSTTIPAIGTSQARWDEGASREPDQAWRHPQAVRVAATKKRFWRRHWAPRAEINGGERCFFFGCLPWRAHPVSYEPPHNTTQ
jgi:hypothetical protein